VSKYDWLLFFHVTGAFLLIGGAVTAGVFNVAAMQRERPSEIAAFLRFARIGVILISIGVLLTLVFGLWLVHAADQGYSYGDAWIVAALVLWVLANALGGIGGRRDKNTRVLAERLAMEGDAPSPDLRARVRDPVSLTFSWGSGLVVLAILGLMIWKPGS
jgi:uncharacterized membrane protein